MKRWLLPAFLAAVLSGCGATPARLASPALPDAARSQPERYVVVTVNNPTASMPSRAGSTPRGYDAGPSYGASDVARTTSRDIARDFELSEVAAWPIPVLNVHCILYRIPDSGSRSELLARLPADRRVRLAQGLQVFSTSSADYNDPYFALQHGLPEMAIVAAHQWSRGDGVTVAVIDTGIDSHHPDLLGRVRSSRNFVDRDATQFELDRHGTQIAGVIAAVGNNGQGIVGIAPGVDLLALKACWQDDASGASASCNSFTLAQAISAAIDAGADVLNLSLVGPADPLLSELTEKAVEHGAIVVGAVPPDGRTDGFPAGVRGVLPVDMAEQSDGTPGVLRAPGREILTLAPNGHYDFASGSSLSTASVAGIVALMRARDRHLRPAEVRSRLAKSMQNVGTDASIVQSINACAALSSLLATSGCPIPANPDTKTR